jgi:Fur family ferric uptake transcriptional regulator
MSPSFRADSQEQFSSDTVIVRNVAPSYHPVMASLTATKSSKMIRRNTRQRREIREVFERNDRPLAADEVYHLAQQKMAGLGMATVYRAIKSLSDEGWLVPVEVPGAPPRYEVRGKAHHHHFHCLKCGKLFELDGCLERLGKLIPASFRVVDHVVLIYGYCAGCDHGPKVKPAAARRNATSPV